MDNLFKNLKYSLDKMKDFVDKAEVGISTTIMHPEVYPTDEGAKQANADVRFKSFFSAQKEAERRLM